MRGLNARNQYFLRANLLHGFYAAYKVAGYTKARAQQILLRDDAKEYMLSLLGQAVKGLKWSLQDVLQQRYKLATNKETPVKLRDDILKDLTEVLNVDDRASSAPAQIMNLTPSKQIEEANFEEKSSEKESSEETGS